MSVNRSTLLDPAALAAAVGTSFDVDWAGTARTLVLESVDEPRSENGCISFGATFQADAATPPEQGTRSFSSARFDTTELFIVPIARDDHGVLFHAAFALQEVPG